MTWKTTNLRFPISWLDFFSGFCLPYDFYYTHRHHSNSFKNFRVFSIQIYQLYAYSSFWAWVSGSLIWAPFYPSYSILPPSPKEVNEAASSGFVWCLFLKLDTLMYLSSGSVVHRGLPLLFLFWLELFCEGSSTQRCTRSSVSWQFLAISRNF